MRAQRGNSLCLLFLRLRLSNAGSGTKSWYIVNYLDGWQTGFCYTQSEEREKTFLDALRWSERRRSWDILEDDDSHTGAETHGAGTSRSTSATISHRVFRQDGYGAARRRRWRYQGGARPRAADLPAGDPDDHRGWWRRNPEKCYAALAASCRRRYHLHRPLQFQLWPCLSGHGWESWLMRFKSVDVRTTVIAYSWNWNLIIELLMACGVPNI